MFIIIRDVRINLDNLVLYEESVSQNVSNEKIHGISFLARDSVRFNVHFENVDDRNAALKKLDFHTKLE